MSKAPGSSTQGAIRFSMMGSIRLSLDGQPISIGNRALSLLGALALADGVLSKEKAATTMWPESPSSQCLGNLRNLLYVLRKEHPELAGVIQVEGELLRLAELEVDVWTLQHLLRTPDVPTAALLQSYPGHLAMELDGANASALRQSLASEFFVWVGTRLTLLETSRQYEEALRLAEHVLRVDPYHEPTYRALMRLHAALGDTPLALRAYEACREALEEGVGEPPSRETRALARRIKDQQELPAPRSSSTPGMVGRIVEWRQLTEAWRTCLGGRSALLTVSGISGIGKTRLTEEFARYLTRQGHRAHPVQCLELQTRTPFAVLMNVMERLERPPPGGTRRETSSEALQEALRIPPQLLQLQLQQKATNLLRQELPCCVIIDDAQWCDPETLAWLQEATAALSQNAVLWIFSHTPLLQTSPLRRLLNAVARHERFLQVELAPLSAEESTQLAQQCGAGHPDALVRLAEGSPLAITQILSHQWQAEDPLPQTLAAAFERQLTQAGEAQLVAAILAIAERPLPLRFFDALELPGQEAHLDALLALRLVEECPDGTVRLVHGLLKNHVLQQLRRIQLRRLNGLIGRTWMRLANPEAPPEQIAENLEAGGLEAEAAQYFLKVVGPLILRGQLELAYGYAERAEALATRTHQSSLAWQAALQMANTALAACDKGQLSRAIARLDAHVVAATEPDASYRIELFRVELEFMEGNLVAAADGYLRLLEPLAQYQDRSLVYTLARRVVRFYLRMRGYIPDRSMVVADQQLLHSLETVHRFFPVETNPQLWSDLGLIIQSEELEARNPRLMQRVHDLMGNEALLQVNALSGTHHPKRVRHPSEASVEALPPFERTREILMRLSRLTNVNERIMGLDSETRQAFRQHHFSLVVFLRIASKQILKQIQWHAAHAFSSELEVSTYYELAHPRRGLLLADAFVAQGLPQGFAVVEAHLNIHRCWMRRNLDDQEAFLSVLERLIVLDSTVGAHHPFVRRDVGQLKQEAAILHGEVDSALEASTRAHHWLQENGRTRDAAWHAIQDDFLRRQVGRQAATGQQLQTWVELALGDDVNRSDRIALLSGFLVRAFTEEGQQEKAHQYRQQAASSFDQSLQRLAPSHRPIYAAIRAATLEGRSPRPEEYSGEFIDTFTEEEQAVADNALRWISGGA